MLWLLTYFIVGMIYVSIAIYPNARKTAQQKKDDDEHLIATFIISLVLIACLTPFWIVLMAFGIAKLFHKRMNTNDKP